MYALLTGSVVFVQENRAEQWYQRKLVPYYHYVPVVNDLSDLKNQIEWARHNEDKAAKIGA